jgi:hypothetical protein
VLAHKFTDERTHENCISFLSEIKTNCYPQILKIYLSERYKKVNDRKLFEFVCDGFRGYRSAFNKLFRRTAVLTFGIPIACKKYGLLHNNNPVERYNGKLDDRLKIIRGGFGSFEGAESFLNMRRIMHNFVNPHQQLRGKTPAEMAEIILPLKRNRLLSLIEYCALNLRG